MLTCRLNDAWLTSSCCPNADDLQALCFMAGANSIFDGDKLLTTPNNERSEDMKMFDMLGLQSRPAFVDLPEHPTMSKSPSPSAAPKVAVQAA